MLAWRRSSNMKKALAVIAALSAPLFGIHAEAATLAYTVPSDYSNSQMGAVTGSRVTTRVDSTPKEGVVTGLNRDPGLYETTVNGKSGAILRQYTYSTTNLVPVRIITTEGDPNKPIATGIVSSAANPHGAASNGKYVFMADYDLGTVAVAKINGDKLEEVSGMTLTLEKLQEDLVKGAKYAQNGTSYDTTSYGAPYSYKYEKGTDGLLTQDSVTFHAEGVYADGDNLIVAYNVNPVSTGWQEYEDGYLAIYGIDEKNNKLVFKGAAKAPRNVDSVRINKYNDYYILNGIGGYQHYGDQRNQESGVSMIHIPSKSGLQDRQLATLDGSAVIPANVKAQLDANVSDFYNVKTTPDGRAYVLTYGLNGGSIGRFQVWETTVSNLMTSKPKDWKLVIDRNDVGGWFGRINYDYYTKRMWAEIGNELAVYTDGASTPTYTWSAKDFSTNKSFYNFNSVAVLKGDGINGNTAIVKNTVPDGMTRYANAGIAASGDVTYKAAITGTFSDTGYKAVSGDNKTYTFNNDVTITRNGDAGDGDTNAFAGIFARNGNDITVNAGTHKISMNLTSQVGTPMGIYAGNGKNVDLTSGGLKITTNVDAESANSLSHAIQLDAAKDKASHITVNGPVEITMKGGYGGNAVAIQKFDRFGEKSSDSTGTNKITLNGDVTIKGKKASEWGILPNMENSYSRFNNAGLWTNVDNSEINVTGKTDFTVYGNGAAVNASGSKISIGGGRIEVPEGMKYGYYTLGAYIGTINMNTGSNGTTPGTNDVQLSGDIFTLKTGTVNAALTTANSYLKGIIDNGGTTNLWLQNGAKWENVARNTRYSEDNEDVGSGQKSHVTKLTGSKDEASAGVIYQSASSKDLTIDKYSGNTAVLYDHGTSADTLPGGSVTIKSAEAGSGITFMTSLADFMSTDAAKDKVLENLAEKLFYSAYANGEKNLSGTVKIASGLTTSSTAVKVGDISFSDGTTGTKSLGQGFYDYTPESEVVYNTGAIINSEDINVTRKADEAGKMTVTQTEKNADSSKKISALYDGTANSDYSKHMVVDLNGHDLELNADGSAFATTVYVGANKYIDIKNSSTTDKDKKLVIHTSTTSQAGDGIYVDAGHLTIDAPVEITDIKGRSAAYGITLQGSNGEAVINGNLKISNVADTKARGAGINAAGILLTGDKTKFTVNGNVDISGVKGAALKTVGADSEISVGGGTITATEDADKSHNYQAIRVDKGTINVNMKDGAAGTNTTKITGDIYATGQYGKKVIEYTGGQLVDWNDAGKVNLALTDKDSSWTGAAVYDQYTDDYGTGGNTVHDIGEINLYLTNGATWTNDIQSHGTTTTVADKNPVWEGSQLASLHGGDSEDTAGVIVQNSDKDISVNTYSGNTTVIYKHDAAEPTSITGGNFRITNAAENSAITLLTDNSGLTKGFADADSADDKNKVSEVLNKLANKLFYTSYTDNHLAGTVKIASGLTTSAKEIMIGDISWSTDNTGTKKPGQGYYAYKSAIDIPDSQTEDHYGKAILGAEDRDTTYVNTGVLKNGVYNFTKDTTIAIDGTKDTAENKRDTVLYGPWFYDAKAVISGSVPVYDEAGNQLISGEGYAFENLAASQAIANNVTMNMNGHKLTIDAKYDGSVAQAGIAAVGAHKYPKTAGKVEINNAGAIDITVKGSGATGGLFADGGGKLYIHNGGENAESKVLTIRAGSKDQKSGAAIKSINGSGTSGDGYQSEITIDGLVDIIADGKVDSEGYTTNEGVSAVASDINIGGGTIKAINGAWAAIRAYGEFVTKNYGIVNVNAANCTYETDSDKAHKVSGFDIGDNKVIIEGDFVTNGGMGTKGQINIGMGKDSHWIGNYADTNGYGVTQGQLGAVNLKMKDGAYWKGFGNGAMNVEMTGKDTNWLGFNTSDKMQLTLKDGATWYNAITPEQKDQSNKATNAKLGYLTAENGIIDMTGAHVFTASSSSLSGSTTGGSSISESENGTTGSVDVTNYSGSSTVIYKHEIVDNDSREKASFYGNKAANVLGGDFKIAKVAENSAITLLTDNTGVDTESTVYTDRNLVSDLLDKLANKLFYTGYADGHLKGTVKIASGLTASSAEKKVGDISFYTADEAAKAGKTEGEGYYKYDLAYPDSQTQDTYGKAILGSEDRDTLYKETGVLKDGVYNFTKDTTIAIDGTTDTAENNRDKVVGGPWVNAGVQAAISGSRPMAKEDGTSDTFNAKTVFNSVDINLNNHKLDINVKYSGAAGQTGISAIGPLGGIDNASKVELKNAGTININAKGSGMTAGLFANGGGKLTIHNGGDDAENKVLTVRGNSKIKASGVGIKTMNGNFKSNSGDNKHSEITIDGLVDVLADGKADKEGYASNEAISAVASDINIGGGTIKAVNGAWAAIRAYGEFQTPNYGIVNVNADNRQYVNESGKVYVGTTTVHKVSNFDIGKNKVIIEGDLVTNGGMGTKGQINIGMGKDSHWIGNYADTNGYGVTQGQLGAVNLKMKDGAYWKGFGNGAMNVEMTGKDTNWLGFNTSDKMQLTLKDGATWHNAITPDQKDQSNKATNAKLGYLTADNGIIDMTGAHVFKATSSSLSGRPTSDGSSAIKESENGTTGNVDVKNYSGSSTVIYKHEIVDDTSRDKASLYGNKAANVIGGDFKITVAAEKSEITLLTDNTGVNTDSTVYTDRNLVNDLLDKLANKLFYTGYTDGHLKGYVEIASGLTTSSVKKKIGDISFYTAAEASKANKTEGEGYYKYDLVYPDKQVKNPMNTTIDGSADSEEEYKEAGIYKEDKDVYDFTENPATVNGDKGSAVDAGTKDISLDSGEGKVILNGGDTGTGVKAESGKTADIKGNADITGQTGISADGEGSKVDLHGITTITAKEDGIVAKNGGSVTADKSVTVNAGENGKAIDAGKDSTVTLNGGGTINGDALSEGGTITAKDTEFKKDVNASEGGTVSLKGSSVDGNTTASGENSNVTADNSTLSGNAAAENGGTMTLTKGSVGGKTTASGENSKVTTHGTTLTGDALAENGGALDLTGGKAAGVTADNGKVTANGTVFNGNVAAENGGTMTLTNGSLGGKTTASGENSTVTTNGTNLSGAEASNGGSLKLTDGTISGDVKTDKDSTAAVTMDKAGAFFKGNMDNDGTASVSLTNGGSWNGDSKGSGKTDVTVGKGSTWTGASANENTSVDLAGNWKQTGDSKVADIKGNGGTLDKSGPSSGKTDIAHYSGNNNIIYSHNKNNPTEVYGGDTTIQAADKGSSVNMITDNQGLKTGSSKAADKNAVSEAMNALANKLYYNGDKGNLTGKLTIADGLTASSVSIRTGALSFKDNGQGFYDYTKAFDIEPEIGDYETPAMKITKSAIGAAILAWRSDMNDMYKRLGDLHAGAESGIWARTYGGRFSYNHDRMDIRNDFWAVQTGADKRLKNGWHVGGAFGYYDGDAKFENGAKGDPKLYTLAAYGTKVSDDGQYVDIVLKGGNVQDKFHGWNEGRLMRFDGKYDTSAFGISAEYGRKFQTGKGFITPQAELAWSHIASDNFTVRANSGDRMKVEQSGVDSLIGRLGVAAGVENDRGNLYFRASLFHEFDGDGHTWFRGTEDKRTSFDLGDTWTELSIGGNYNLSPSSSLYADFTRSFGGDYKVNWKVNAGVRFSF